MKEHAIEELEMAQNCVAYIRVSTEKQAEEGYGIESQKRDIENYARKNALIITDWYMDDGYTGANMNRPQLQRLIRDCSKKRVKCVVAFKLDRLSRSMVDGIYLIERVFQPNGIDFRCVHDSVSYDSPMEQAYTQMMAVFAQLDKNTMLLRMRGGMLERVKQGYWWGGGNLPYCYSYDAAQGVLIPIPERAEQARRAMGLFISGYSDLRIQNALGFQNETTVRHILTTPVNAGMILYKGEIYKGLHKPIFSEDEFNLLQQIRASRKNAKTQCHTDANMLTGLCYCGVCGCKMRYQKWTGGRHKIYCYSRNSSLSRLPNWNTECNNSLEWASDIESRVSEIIKRISVDISAGTLPEKKSAYEQITQEIAKEKEKLKRLCGLYADGDDTVIEMIQSQREKIKKMQLDANAEQEKEKNAPQKDYVRSQIKKIADVWDSIDNQQKNKILKIIVDKIVVVNGNVEIIIKNY